MPDCHHDVRGQQHHREGVRVPSGPTKGATVGEDNNMENLDKVVCTRVPLQSVGQETRILQAVLIWKLLLEKCLWFCDVIVWQPIITNQTGRLSFLLHIGKCLNRCQRHLRGSWNHKRTGRWVSGITSYLDWGAFSHRLLLQAPSNQIKEEYKTDRREK